MNHTFCVFFPFYGFRIVAVIFWPYFLEKMTMRWKWKWSGGMGHEYIGNCHVVISEGFESRSLVVGKREMTWTVEMSLCWVSWDSRSYASGPHEAHREEYAYALFLLIFIFCVLRRKIPELVLKANCLWTWKL